MPIENNNDRRVLTSGRRDQSAERIKKSAKAGGGASMKRGNECVSDLLDPERAESLESGIPRGTRHSSMETEAEEGPYLREGPRDGYKLPANIS